MIAGKNAESPGKNGKAFGDAEFEREIGDEEIVLGGGFEEGLINAAQHADRIVPASFPEVAIEPAKEVDGGVVPAPTEVVGDLQEGLQGFWQRGTNLKRGDGFHGVP